MPEDIGQCFLNDSKNGSLYVRREPRKSARLDFERRLYAAALRDPLHIPGKRREQTNFIEQGGMQKVRHGANLLNGAIYNTAGLSPLFLWRFCRFLQDAFVHD